MTTCMSPSPPPCLPVRDRWRGPVRVLGLLFAGLVAAAAPVAAQSRGELLYTTHCISCHSTEMHWRDKRAASDWASLKFQVRRWQAAASLGWSDGDVVDVARYLNELIYRFEATTDPVSSASSGGPAAALLALQAPLASPVRP